MKKTLSVAALFAASAALILKGQGVNYIPKGQVTGVEATYMAGRARFQLTTGDSTCPAGIFLDFVKSDPEAVKAAYATLLGAFLSGKSILAVYSPSDVHAEGPGNCRIQFLTTTN